MDGISPFPFVEKNVKLISLEAELSECSFFKFSDYLSGSTSSLTSWSNLLYLLRKYKITSTKNTNAVMQPTALPNIMVMLLHLYSISVLSSISVLGVESKLNRLLLFIFKKKQNKLTWMKIKILSKCVDHTSLTSLDYFTVCG